jgi:hypothetical protein
MKLTSLRVNKKSTEEYRRSACEDFTCEEKIPICVAISNVRLLQFVRRDPMLGND